MHRLKNNKVEGALYTKALLDSIHYGATSPFIPIYGVELGASPIEIGLLYALTNFSLNFFQLIWGYLSDKLRKHVMFIVLSGVLSSIVFIILLFTKSHSIFIFLVVLHSIIGSMSIPTFIAYSSQVLDESRWRRFSENVNFLNYAGWITATLTVGLSSHLGLNGFIIGFLIAAMSSILGTMIIWIYCRELEINYEDGRPSSLKSFKFSKSSKFLNFVLLSAGYGFCLSMAWPLFTITLTRVSAFTLLEISILDVVYGLSAALGLVLLRSYFSMLNISRILSLSSSLMALTPLVYAVAPQLPFLIAIHAFVGIFSAYYDAASLTYILENTSVEERGFYSALYNLSVGSALLAGSLVAGYALEILENLWTLFHALAFLYLITALGRLMIGLLYRKLC